MFGFSVDKFGLWEDGGKDPKKAKMKAFDQLMDDVMEEALHKVKVLLNNAAEQMAQDVQNYIIRQMGGAMWPPLSENYAAWKERMGLDDRILIATQKYHSSITVLPPRDRLGRFTSFRKATASQIPDMRIQVGLPPNARARDDSDLAPDTESPTLRQLGLWLEYGTSTMPARAHFGPATFMFRNRRLPRIMDAVGEHMNKIGKMAKAKKKKGPRPSNKPDDYSPKPDRDVRPDQDVRPDPDVILPPDRD